MNIGNIGIVGAGTMGNGIAHVFALKGYNVFLIDTDISIVKRAINTISNNMERQINKGLILESDKQNALKNIVPIAGIKNSPDNIDFAIEAVYENFELKFQIIRQMKELLKPECILASNTSSVSITGLSQAYKPEMFIGMHFMNPVPVMQLVEIIRGFSTSNETFNTTRQLAIELDKTPVEVQDYPGFISNRVLIPMINEAIFALMEGVASKEDIDTVMKLGMNHPIGPLALADLIGLDVCLSIMEVLYKGYSDSKYRPCPLLKKMVEANKLGRKTGEGFFKYN